MELKCELYDYQRAGVEFALEKRYSLNGDRPGLGKTAQALALCARVNPKRVLIVCPAFLVWNWKKEIEKFLGNEHKDRFLIVSYDSLHKVVFMNFNVVVCDEIHYLKSITAQRTIRLHKMIKEAKPDYFLGLSGTPIKNRVPEFYSLLKLCWYGGRYFEFDRYSETPWKFCVDFTHEKKVKIGYRRFTKFEGVKNPERLRDLVKNVYIRRRAEDVLTLPDQIRQVVMAADKSRNDILLKAAWDAYESPKPRTTAGDKPPPFATAKAVNALSKIPFTIDLVRTLLPNRVVVFSDHVQAAKKLSIELGDVAKCITGATPMDYRKKFVEELNEGKIQVLICTIGALSVGVNLTSCNYMVFNDYPWVPADMDQCEARIHRIGQKNACLYYYVMSSEMDHRIYKTLEAKRKVISEVGS